ncbi:MAG: 50S ribosomal protein L31 [Chloroflexi bacterium]|nr:50S ribosomal protein L31 [Chloroflexota bacterium]MBI3741784.1 50S ribosomal protein L31 [Chloroflexota bacterium]
MKSGIHPQFYTDTVVKCSGGHSWVTGSTQKEIHTDVCSICHPFYTGEQRIIDTAGQVERFMKRASAQAQFAPRPSEEDKRAKKDQRRATPAPPVAQKPAVELPAAAMEVEPAMPEMPVAEMRAPQPIGMEPASVMETPEPIAVPSVPMEESVPVAMEMPAVAKPAKRARAKLTAKKPAAKKVAKVKTFRRNISTKAKPATKSSAARKKPAAKKSAPKKAKK